MVARLGSLVAAATVGSAAASASLGSLSGDWTVSDGATLTWLAVSSLPPPPSSPPPVPGASLPSCMVSSSSALQVFHLEPDAGRGLRDRLRRVAGHRRAHGPGVGHRAD